MTVDELIKKLSDFKEDNPELSRDLNVAVNINKFDNKEDIDIDLDYDYHDNAFISIL